MSMTDPIADFLTRIRNAQAARHEMVSLSGSRMKEQLARILTEEGYVESYSTEADGPKSELRVRLKYGPDGTGAIAGIARVSRPGLRIYSRARDIPKVLNGLGVNIVSTAQGIMNGETARAKNVGGEILCKVW